MGSRWVFVLAMVAACAKGSSNNAPSDGTSGSGVTPSDANGSSMPTIDAPPDAVPCSGLPCDAIYVAPSGADTNAGTQSSPLASIATAVTRAGAKTPIVDVYVQGGMYTEPVIVIPSGVRVHGGFDTAWTQDAMSSTQINGASPAVTITSATKPTGLDHLSLKAADASGQGASSYAIAK